MSEQEKNQPISEEEAHKIADIMLGGWKEPIILDGEQVFISTEEQKLHDTHFAGFAKALWNELLANTRTFHSDYEESQQTIIARRAYDLAMHVIENLNSYLYDVTVATTGYSRNEELLKSVPDLAELPSESKE